MDAYDEALSLQLAGGNRELAGQLFRMLLRELPLLREQLNNAGQPGDMYAHAHKINGATRYCGVPELQQAAHALDVALKKGEHETVPGLLEALNSAIGRLLREYGNDR
jgi:two-component system sensor histidine kinase BarA